MTGERRGRGRPEVFGPEHRRRLVELVAGGLTVAQAAAKVGMSRPAVYHQRGQHPEFDAALAVAQKEGASVRRAGRDCQVDRCGTAARYVKAGCRCEACTAAATRARRGTGGRAEAAGVEDGGGQGETVPLPVIGRGEGELKFPVLLRWAV